MLDITADFNRLTASERVGGCGGWIYPRTNRRRELTSLNLASPRLPYLYELTTSDPPTLVYPL